MRAALYARVSSEEQVEGYSIDAQRRAFANLVKDKQWTAYQEYIDEGKSARSDNISKIEFSVQIVSLNSNQRFLHSRMNFSLLRRR